MKIKIINIHSLVLLIVMASCSQKIVRQTSIQENDDGGAVTTTIKVNNNEIAKLKTEWQNEYLEAMGTAPVIDKYPEESRNKMLARQGALLDAQRNLAKEVSSTKLTATTSMSDYSTSDFVQSRVNALLKNVKILNERYDEGLNAYEVRIQMPKVEVINIIEEYNKMY